MLTAPWARADYQAGLNAYDNGDYARALKEWQPAAESGEARAEYGMGLLFDYGRGVKADPAQAGKWYNLAAAQNLPEAQSNLATLYAEGHGVSKDLAKANELWLQAAKAGDPSAQFNLGLSYYRGEAVPKSYPDAASWFLKSAEAGEVSAQYAIGEMYRLGRGVPKDPNAARRWFTKAATAGNAAAAERLASLPPAPAGAPPSGNAESVMNPTPLVASTKSPTSVTSQDAGSTAPAVGATVGGTGGGVTAAPAPTVSTAALPPPTEPPAPPAAEPPVPPSTAPVSSGGIFVAPSLTPSSSAATAATIPAPAPSPTPAPTTEGGATTANGLPGTVVPGTSRNADPVPVDTTLTPGVVVPLGADAALTARTLLPAAAAAAPAPAPVPPPPSSGVIDLGLPIAGASSGVTPPASSPPTSSPPTSSPSTTTTVASLPSASETTGGSNVFRIWIGTFKTEGEARLYWSQEVQRFPDLLKPLQLALRQVDLGASQGVWFRVLGGSFGNQEAADHLCGSIKSRSPLDDCRVVLN